MQYDCLKKKTHNDREAIWEESLCKSAESVENYLGAFNLETRVRLVISFLGGWQAGLERILAKMAAVRFFPHERSPSAGEASRHSLSINIRYSQNLSLECVGPPLNKSSCGAVNERAAAFCPSTQRSHCVKSKTSLLPAAGGRQGGRAAKVVLLIQHRHCVRANYTHYCNLQPLRVALARLDPTLAILRRTRIK